MNCGVGIIEMTTVKNKIMRPIHRYINLVGMHNTIKIYQMYNILHKITK